MNARSLGFTVILALLQIRNSQSVVANQTVQCNLDQIESRIHRLESILLEQVRNLKSEFKDNSRTLETQNRGIRNAVEEYKKEFHRVVERPRRYDTNQRSVNTPEVSEKLDEIIKGVQLNIVTLRLIDWDITALKKNVTEFINKTNLILDDINLKNSIDDVFQATSRNTEQPPQIPTANCAAVRQQNTTLPSGIYLVKPDVNKPAFMAFCDMGTQNGGWLIIHNRYHGTQDFNLGWQDYKNGFGNIAGEYWLGLEKLYQLTGNQINELLIELVDNTKIRTFAHYSFFSIGSEEEGYALKVLGGYQGTAGDSFIYHAGSKFSTKDKDQDSWLEGNCAQSHGGGWWYKSCDKSNLNGKYLPGDLPEQLLYQGMYWGEFRGPQVGLLQARMMIRPANLYSQPALPYEA
ncbi:ficolin-3-like isoform X2 [Rhynchophorus ferrugineus]|uniref:ficolin-3-like isoform X2 n=1 Tax=Rhynchophorus ferrugineus TaxID=354439 RepID=UPI003FCD5B1C